MTTNNKKTQLVQSLHDFAVMDVKTSIYRKSSANIAPTLKSDSTQVVNEYSSLKDIYNAMSESAMSEYNKCMAISAFRAKYSRLYNLYSCDIENDIENMIVSTNDFTYDMDGNENTPLNIVKSFISYAMKNDCNFCTPIKKENERYIDGIKALKKNQKTESKNFAKNVAKVVAKTTKSDWIQKQIDIMTANGIDKVTAQTVATTMYNNLQSAGK